MTLFLNMNVVINKCAFLRSIYVNNHNINNNIYVAWQKGINIRIRTCDFLLVNKSQDGTVTDYYVCGLPGNMGRSDLPEMYA